MFRVNTVYNAGFTVALQESTVYSSGMDVQFS